MRNGVETFGNIFAKIDKNYDTDYSINSNILFYNNVISCIF